MSKRATQKKKNETKLKFTLAQRAEVVALAFKRERRKREREERKKKEENVKEEEKNNNEREKGNNGKQKKTTERGHEPIEEKKNTRTNRRKRKKYQKTNRGKTKGEIKPIRTIKNTDEPINGKNKRNIKGKETRRRRERPSVQSKKKKKTHLLFPNLSGVKTRGHHFLAKLL
ncbi:MAG: hypothetical protein VXZ18_16510 [Pseudomonadota bacterium]|nr:hypothetical protein [Pseudomonadota bacterium]